MRGVMGVVGWTALLAVAVAPAPASGVIRTFPASSGACSTTLQACIEAAAPEDTIELNTDSDSPIDEDISIAKSLTLTRASGADPTIGGGIIKSVLIHNPDEENNPGPIGPLKVTVSRVTLDNAVLSISLSAGTGHEITVENCIISHAQADDNSRGVDLDLRAPATVIVKNNIIATTGTPLSISAELPSGTASVTALGNTLSASVEDFSARGIAVDVSDDGTANVDIYSNLIHGVGGCTSLLCGAAGIYVRAQGRATARVNIVNNTLDDLQLTANGIEVASPGPLSHLMLSLFNNVVSRAAGSAVVMPPSTPELELENGYNVFFENGDEADWGDYSAGAHTSIVDPQYVSALDGDYHLLATSPLVGAGRNDPPPLSVLPETDADNHPRVAAGLGAVDIGAFESQYVTVTTTTVVTTTTSSTSTTTSPTVVTTTIAAPTTSTSTPAVTTTVATIPGATTTTSVTTPTTTTATSPAPSSTTMPPPVVTTTTIPASTCREEVTYTSIACRMTALASQVRAVPVASLTSKLLGALTRAQEKLHDAQTFSGAGQGAKAKLSARAALRALAKMQVRLRSRAGKRIPDPMRTNMIEAVGRIGRDLRSQL
jgi:hypothetical protein